MDDNSTVRGIMKGSVNVDMHGTWGIEVVMLCAFRQFLEISAYCQKD